MLLNGVRVITYGPSSEDVTRYYYQLNGKKGVSETAVNEGYKVDLVRLDVIGDEFDVLVEGDGTFDCDAESVAQGKKTKVACEKE